MAEVRFEKVTKDFGGERPAVKDFDLTIADKEFLVLVGPSGCGKSTTLRMLAGLEEITSGKIYIADRLVNDVAAKDRDIAMVFQSYALYPHMSVFDNMAFGLKLRRIPKEEIRERVEEAARTLGIEDLLKRKPRALSGGQRQRVALGRAIVRKPAVFLFDEPLSNLDAKLRVQTRAEISKLHLRLGTTFIYVTHDQVEAMTMATRIVVQKEGLIQQVGTPGELYDYPQNMFVAGFIGSPAMNMFEGTVVRDDGELYLDLPGCRLPVPADRTRDVEAHVGDKVIAGLRPENIHAAQYTPPGIQAAEAEANVEVTELLGNETIAHLTLGDADEVCCARLDPRVETGPGRKIQLAVDIDRIHIFDPKTEKALGTAKPVTKAV